MPRYFFHLHNDMDVTDHEGAELPSLEAARAYAVREARCLFGDAVTEKGRVVLAHRIDIEDAHGTVLDTVRFGDVVEIEG
ncbi:hypothetical protein [Sphingosinicella sp. YJ22]|uniref:DUF6894 family protein n=1 Tax=Sphingosinicella sp. YJ22 TaxID=1104780 RepID=UPI00140838F4|nr:hypothetical protein [Sphingosinicella sp. YJ22]